MDRRKHLQDKAPTIEHTKPLFLLHTIARMTRVRTLYPLQRIGLHIVERRT